MVRLPRNEKQTHQLNSRPQMWPSVLTLAMTLTLNFQGQMWNLLYLSQKWSDCHKTKSKHIDWSQDLKCYHWVWPWTWPWPWIFKIKYGIGYISAKNGPIATKQNANTSIKLLASNVTIRLTLAGPWPSIFKVKYEFLYISTKTGPNAKKRKANIMIWTLGLKYDQWVWPWPWPWINIWILKVICLLDHSVTKVRCKDLPDSDWGDFRCWRAVDSSS